MSIRIILVVLIFCVSHTTTFAQADSVVIEGKIENLTARLYRKASEVSFIRRNVLDKNEAVVHTLALATDGSFRGRIPVVFEPEEYRLVYGDFIDAPLLVSAQKTIKIVIQGDSITKKTIPFKFAGHLADVNNMLAQYKVFEKKAFENNDKIIKDIPKLVAQWLPAKVYNTLSKIENEKVTVWSKFSQLKSPSAILNNWVLTNYNYETIAEFYDYLQGTGHTQPIELQEVVMPKITKSLSFAQANALYKFGDYATVQSQAKINDKSSLPITTMAKLLLKYVPLKVSEKSYLRAIIDSSGAKMSDLPRLNQMYKRKNDTLSQLLSYELMTKTYGDAYEKTTTDYLKLYFLNSMAAKLTYDEKTLLYSHAQDDTQDRNLGQSLGEVYTRQMTDKPLADKLKERFKNTPNANMMLTYSIDELPLTDFFKHNTVSGSNLLALIKKANQGKMLYFIPWKIGSEADKRELYYARQWAETLDPNKILFVYLCQWNSNEELWAETAARSRTPGLHLYLTSIQYRVFVNSFESSFPEECGFLDSKGNSKRFASIPWPSEHEAMRKFFESKGL